LSIGLRLLAKLDAPAAEPDVLLQGMADWIQTKCSGVSPETRLGFVESCPTLFCKLHPGAEEVEISLVDPQHLVASANTSTVGPGYHMYLCSMLIDMARNFRASWLRPENSGEDYSDEAEYFFTGDQKKVVDAMSEWLQALTGTFFEEPVEQDLTGTALCMPMEPQFESTVFPITPLGPRDRAWLLKTSQDGESGNDFFAWWTPGFNAEYFLGRALTQMWTNIRWRAPVNDAEKRLLQEVAGSLDAAYKLEPFRPYPWAEWAEIVRFLDANGPSTEFIRKNVAGEPAIGYRRNNVTVVLLGGWRMRLPGSFSEFQPDEGGDFFALNPPNEIWFTAYRFATTLEPGVFESRRQEIREAQPEYLEESENYIAKGAIQEKISENGDRYFLLKSSCVYPSGRAVCSIIFSRPEEKDWALETWRSIRAPEVVPE
jgi:hypothetical protein